MLFFHNFPLNLIVTISAIRKHQKKLQLVDFDCLIKCLVSRINRSELQLLGAVCLMVAWKVREHEPLPALRLVEYSDFNLTPADIMVSKVKC